MCDEIRIVIQSGATKKEIMQKYKISDHTFRQIVERTFNGHRILSVGSSFPAARLLLRRSSPYDQVAPNPAEPSQQA